MKNRKILLENIQFILVGFLLILNGSNSINYPFASYSLIILGTFLIIYVSRIMIKKYVNPLLKLIVMLCESVGLFTTGIILYKEGSSYLHYLYVFGSICLLIGATIYFYKTKKINNF